MEKHNNSYLASILVGIYGLSEYFYRKGFLDAAILCDPVFCERFSGREDNHAEIKLINDFDRDVIEPIVYADIMTMYAAVAKVKEMNIYLKYKATDPMKIRLSYLMDCVYREGIYDGRYQSIMTAKLQMGENIKSIRRGDLTLTQEEWYDHLKFYISKITIGHNKIKLDTDMRYLSELMTVGLKCLREQDEEKERHRRENRTKVYR